LYKVDGFRSAVSLTVIFPDTQHNRLSAGGPTELHVRKGVDSLPAVTFLPRVIIVYLPDYYCKDHPSSHFMP